MLAHLIRTEASSLLPLTAAIGLIRRIQFLGRYVSTLIVPIGGDYSLPCMYVCVQVTGDSIFNLLALADIETDKDDRPVYPQKILSVEVLWNPFDDIVPRQLKKIQPAPKADAERKPEKKAVKQLNVLSFGDEVEEEENEAASFVNDKIKSIHDVLDDSRFLKVEPQVEQLSKEEEEKKNETVLSIREALISKKADSREPEHDPENDDSPEDENEEDFDNRMRSRILKKRRELGDIRQSQSSKKDKSHQKDKELPAHRY
uniref:Uncharacterized protein n=1 Tax=Aegilops tauschii subsp. strangulata TaxID=200361 RepID=A0A453EZ41_AEGTS